MMTYGMPTHRLDAVTYYLNVYRDLDAFGKIFLKKGDDLIRSAEKDQILPLHLPKISRHKWFHQHQGMKVQGLYGKAYVTSQELACLSLLHQGKTFQEMSTALSLSVLAVKTHLKTLQESLGYPLYKLTHSWR